MGKCKFTILILISLSLIYCNPGDVDFQEKITINPTRNKNYGDIKQLLKDTFRIDIKTISVDMEYFPESFYVNCEAEVVFNMYKDNTKPIIHLKPVIEDQNLVNKIELNGEILIMSNNSDINIIEIQDTDQKSIEFQRNLNTGIDHILKISYRKNLSKNYYMFNSQVSDLYGIGNESVFPTINRPAELALHKLRFKVTGNIKFRFIGSGYVREVDNKNQQEWILDTEREISSCTIMFILVPEDDTLYREQIIDGVDLKIIAFKNGASIDEALLSLQSWLPELRNNIGPFPMPRGVSIFLTANGGGMEYYGGTISSLRVFRHEIFHMYYGCSTVLATYRDSWIDEAVNEWYKPTVSSSITYPIYDSYTSNIVSGRSPVGIGFDRRAYVEGSRIFEHIARKMGGRQAMIGFLSFIHKNYSFKPFTTRDLVQYLKEYSGLDYEDNFNNWLFTGENTDSNSTQTNNFLKKNKADLTPPQSILNKYEELKNGVEK